MDPISGPPARMRAHFKSRISPSGSGAQFPKSDFRVRGRKSSQHGKSRSWGFSLSGRRSSWEPSPPRSALPSPPCLASLHLPPRARAPPLPPPASPQRSPLLALHQPRAPARLRGSCLCPPPGPPQSACPRHWPCPPRLPPSPQRPCDPSAQLLAVRPCNSALHMHSPSALVRPLVGGPPPSPRNPHHRDGVRGSGASTLDGAFGCVRGHCGGVGGRHRVGGRFVGDGACVKPHLPGLQPFRLGDAGPPCGLMAQMGRVGELGGGPCYSAFLGVSVGFPP